jgi:tRNA (guanine37-N1)-methyltransferase
LLDKHVNVDTPPHPTIIQSMLDSGEITPVESSYSLKYEHLTATEVFRRLIPNVKEWPSSFETAGHLAHVNLRTELVPYKLLIGQVLLDKNRQITTVVNKTSSIATQFRTFPMELIGGVDNTMVEVKEYGARFKFDFRKVYWNSRLQYEHELIVKSMPKEHVVCDMMAGIGPFAVPCAQKGCTVYANDLNPKSYEYLVGNTKLNKVEKHLHAYNLCGRAFVKELIEQHIQFDRVLMNLPASAIDFLDVFVGLLGNGGDEWWTKASPMIHTYCFSSELDRTKDVMDRVGVVLGCDASELIDASVREVRDVAPNKWMMCISFRVPDVVLFGREKKRRNIN